MTPNAVTVANNEATLVDCSIINESPSRIRCALLGCGMMGQEHISYIMGYSKEIRIDFLCDPHPPSLEQARKVMAEFVNDDKSDDNHSFHHEALLLDNEDDLLAHADDIDLLVIASPNYLHTPTMLKWGLNDLVILVEKPVAVSQDQHDQLVALQASPDWKAKLWVAMEYRYMPAVAKLLQLLPEIGDIRMVTIRENRYPFLHKVGKWNRFPTKTGDTLVEKCCHFFDLFRLITGQEVQLDAIQTVAQRGLNYETEEDYGEDPIIDSAFVTMPFLPKKKGEETNTGESSEGNKNWSTTIGCLELCMYAEGSRNQEEIIVTGSKGRVEAYMPENKVYLFQRPTATEWTDRSVPPPSSTPQIFDCSNIRQVSGMAEDTEMPIHAGYHYGSTAVEWYHLIREIRRSHRHPSEYDDSTSSFQPQVSLQDGLAAVEIGIHATAAIANNKEKRIV